MPTTGALTTTTPTTLRELLDAERRIQDRWETSVPAWHPTNRSEPGAASDATGAPEGTGESGQENPPATVDTPNGPGDLPFSLDDVGDDFQLTGQQAREWLVARQAQLQAPVTRRTQELAAERERLGENADLLARIEAEDTRRDALNEILLPYGLQIPEDAFPDAANAESVSATGQQLPEEPADPELDALRAEVEELRQWRDGRVSEETQAERRREFNQHVTDALDAHAVNLLGAAKTAEDLPERVRDDIVTRALAAPRLPSGLLDFDTAIAEHTAFVKAEREAYLASKDVPVFGTTGANSHGGTKVDLSTAEARRKHALTVAGRHF